MDLFGRGIGEDCFGNSSREYVGIDYGGEGGFVVRVIIRKDGNLFFVICWVMVDDFVVCVKGNGGVCESEIVKG